MRSSSIGRKAALYTVAVASVALLTPQASAVAATGTTPRAPRASTGRANQVSASSVVLNGAVNPHSLATTYYFEYGPTVVYGSQTATASLAGGTAAIKVHQPVARFAKGYHYRLVATNADGTKYGRDRVFVPKTKRQTSEFRLPKTFAATPFGGTFVLSGTLTGPGNANRAVVLQASPYPYRTPFVDVGAPILTTGAGGFSFHVVRLSIATRFRVATAGPPLLHSPIVPEQVAVRVTLKARHSVHTGLVRLYGTVTPAEMGARVFFQLQRPASAKKAPRSEKPIKLEKPGSEKSEEAEERAEERREAPRFSTKFSAVVKHATRSVSRFSAIVRIRDTGRYRAFVQVRPGPQASGPSPSILLHATASKKHKKRIRR
jgi:hypothetical protein